MPDPIKVIDIELSQPLHTIRDLDGYAMVQGLVRLRGTPIGYVKVPVQGDECPAEAIREAVLAKHSYTIVQELLRDALTALPQPGSLRISDLFSTVPANPSYDETDAPLVTVAVCTREAQRKSLSVSMR